MAIVRVQNQDGTISQVDDSTLSKPMPQKPGAIRALGDTLLKFGSGAVGATKAAIDAAGPNVVSKSLGNAAQALEGAQSDYAIAQDQIAAQRAQNAEGKGAVAEIGATLRNFIDRPVASIAQGAGSIVPTAAAMIASRGKINPAAAGIGLGAVQGAGAVKGSIYDSVKQDATAKGLTEQQAEKLATDAQAYSGQNRDQIALGAGLGAVAGATGAEATSLLTGSARETAKSRLRETLKGFATEGGTEAAQGGQEQYAANVARNRLGAGIDPLQGVAGQATAEGIAGGVVGGAFSLADTFQAKEQLKSTILQQGNGGVISQAAATAVDTGAAQPVMGLPNYAGEPLVTFPDGTTMTRAEAQAKYTADELAQFEQRVGMNQKPAVAGLLQTREANPMIVFADGSTGTKQQFDEYLAGLPNEAERMKARARFLGYAPQQADAQQEQAAPVRGLLQSRDQDPMIVYPDGSTGKRSEFDGYINSLPEQQRVTEMARLLGYGTQQGGENATQQPVAEVAAQSGQEELANAQTGAGNKLSATGSGAGLGANAATPTPGMRGDIPPGTQPRTSADAGNSTENAGVDTYVIRDKQTGDVIRATENPNERVSDAYELVPAKQHKQDVKAGKFKPVDLNSAKPGDVINLNGVQWRKLDNGGFEQVMGEQSQPVVKESLTTEQPTTEQSSAVDAKPNNDITANDAATSVFNELPEPTEAQKQAGNYKVGRMKVGGLDISVENPDQSMRTGKDPDGTPWETVTNGHYGYIKGVKARSPDKEHVDVNVKPGTTQDFAGDVFIVNQNDPRTGNFDEPKVYMGYTDEAEAEAAYRSNYAPDWQGFGGITRVPMADFKAMLDNEQAFLKPVTVSQPTQGAQNGRQVQGQETTQEVTTTQLIERAKTRLRMANNALDKAKSDDEKTSLKAKVAAIEKEIRQLRQKAADEFFNDKPTGKPASTTPQQKLTNDDVENLFGLKAKRQKALQRIAEGRGWFGSEAKAKDFVRVNGLSDTHEAVKGKGLRWDIVEKAKKEKQPQQNIIKQAQDMGRLQVITVGDKPTNTQPKRPQPGQDGYTLEMAREDLGALMEEQRSNGIVADARLDERIARMQELVNQLADEQEAPAQENESIAKAKADLDSALSDLGDIFGKNFRAEMTPEQEQKLIPVLTRLFDAAFRLGYQEFKQAAKFVLDTIKSKIGNDIAESVTIDQLQGSYIAMAGKYGNKATSKRDVVNVDSKADIEAVQTDSSYVKNDATPTNEVIKDGNTGQAAATGADGNRPLEGASTQDARINETSGNTEPSGTRSSTENTGPASNPNSKRNTTRGGLGNDEGTIPVSARRTRSKRGSTEQSGLFDELGNEQANQRTVEVQQARESKPSASNYKITDLTKLGEGGQKTKYRNNIAAIQLLNELQESGRQATVNGQTITGNSEIRFALRDAINASPQIEKDGKTKLDINIEFNGKNYTSESGISDAVNKTLGDAAEATFTLADGKTLNRGSEVAAALFDSVSSMPADGSLKVGSVGSFDVVVYSDAKGNKDAVIELNGNYIGSVNLPSMPESMLYALRGLPVKVRDSINQQRGLTAYLESKLEAAKRTQSEIEAMPASGDWEGEADLQRAREQYKDVLKKLAEREAEKPADDASFSRTQRSDLAPQSDLYALSALFTELETDKKLRKLVADRKVDKHPMADEIKRVDRDFYDIIGQLEDEGRLKINCKD